MFHLIIPHGVGVGVDDAYTGGECVAEVRQLRRRRRHRVLRAHHHGHVASEHGLVDQRVARLDGARDGRGEDVAHEALEEEAAR